MLSFPVLFLNKMKTSPKRNLKSIYCKLEILQK